MVQTLAFNPALTTNIFNSFAPTTVGLVQGVAMDDPASRNYLRGGVLAASETLPMFGGVAITELLPPPAVYTNSPESIGSQITRATSAAAITGLSVYNQLHSAFVVPGGGAPVTLSGGQVNFYRLGSNARIAVQCQASLVSFDQTSIASQVSWDFGSNQLVPYVAAYAGETPTAYSYATSTGLLTLTLPASTGVPVGSLLTLTGFTGANTPLNGSFVVTQTGTTTIVQAPAGLGALTPTGGTVVGGGGAFPCKLDYILPTGNKIVTFNPNTGLAAWAENGSCALITI